MKSKIFIASLTLSVILFTVGLFQPKQAIAHCDGLDGPVVKAAQNALEMGNVNLVLIWVQKKDEGEIEKAFQRTLAVRKLNPQAKELADTYFFGTLVRIHRSGEGAPYTGLQPAGRDLGLAIPAADKALEDGEIEPLLNLLTEVMQTGVRERFKLDPSQEEIQHRRREGGSGVCERIRGVRSLRGKDLRSRPEFGRGPLFGIFGSCCA
jgi:hypothetical protein